MPLPEIYERLSDATPDEKRAIVLQLIEEHPEGQLELPTCDEARADLDGIDLGGSTLQEQFEPAQLESAPWWHADFQGVQLRNANLRRARLWNANLKGGGRLRHADLAGASLGEANLQNALLTDANLQGTWLESADLQGASLKSADLRDAVLDDANLQGASLEDANLDGASLRGARIQEVDLTRACIANIRIYGAWLDKTRLEWEQIDARLGKNWMRRGNRMPRNEHQAIAKPGAHTWPSTRISLTWGIITRHAKPTSKSGGWRS